MSLARLGRILRLDLGWQLRRPLFWIWVGLVSFMAWGLSGGGLSIRSGEATVGGTEAWLTSQFAVAQMLAIVVFVLYVFFIAVAAGMAVIRDEEEWSVGPLLHATPLRPAEYVWGKALAAYGAFLLVLAAHLAVTVLVYHAVPHPGEDLFGPFRLANYLVPALAFALPPILFVGGVSLALGERTRRPVLVYLFPILLLALTVFLWDWSPDWLDARLNRWLMWIDVSGFRWLNETWLEVDRGVEFYNRSPIAFDAGFVASRLAAVAAGLGAVAWTARRFGRRVRGSGALPAGTSLRMGPEGAEAVVRREAAPTTRATHDRVNGGMAPARGTAAAGGLGAGAPREARREALRVRVAPPGIVGATLQVARAEVVELVRSPGLYLFVPLVLLQTLGSSLVAVGPLDTRLVVTAGGAALRSSNTLALLICLLLAFYLVESLERDRATGLVSLARSTPVGSLPLLLGKALPLLGVAVVVLVAAMAGVLVAILVQGVARPESAPFGWLWGLGLLPTFVVWLAFLLAVHALGDNRYVTYGTALCALTFTLYRQLTGGMSWVGNWMLWDALEWTDMGLFPLNRDALVANRLLALTLAVLFVTLAVLWHRRRERDPLGLVAALRPARLARAALALSPLALVPLGLGVWIWLQVQEGFQGEERERLASDYHRKNVATYRDHPLPAVVELEMELGLWPERRRLESRGRVTLVNREPDTLRRIPFTTGSAWQDLRWTSNGESVRPEDRAGLHVFRPRGGLAPGDTLRLGWSFRSRHPDGWTVNGGGTGTFVLPAGVVLHSFGTSMAPIPGFLEGVGVDPEDRPEPEDRSEGWWRGRTPPAFGLASPFTARVRVTGPAGWTFNSVGVLVADTIRGDRRTRIWETDYPVRFLNVVGGRWAVREGRGTRVFHHPGHPYNVAEIGEALDAARRHYSAWFAPFPWQELRLSEFPDLARYAQGFPTNIVFSEGIGFLTDATDERAGMAFLVTAHEAAHQWWGNLLTPGEGPGGAVLSEGMAHFATALLVERVRGEAARRAFLERIERDYAESRRADAERPLVATEGDRPGDRAVIYDRGGWAFWRLMGAMGRERMLRGLRSFLDRYRHGPDFPVLHDFLDHMRGFAGDTARFDETVDRWFRSTDLPRYRIESAGVSRDSLTGDWLTRVRLANVGSGDPAVTVAVSRGERPEAEAFLSERAGGDVAGDAAGDSAYRALPVTLRLAAGRDTVVTFRSDFEPETVVVDPDVTLLMLGRGEARWEL